MTAKLAVTQRQLLEGIAERLAGLELFVNALADERTKTLEIQKTLADHVRRLVREKDILQSQLAANRFMAEPLNPGTITTTHVTAHPWLRFT